MPVASSSSPSSVQHANEDALAPISSSAVENGDVADERALLLFTEDLAKDKPDNLERDLFRTASELVARCSQSKTFVQYIKKNAAMNPKYNQLMTSAFDSRIEKPIMVSQGGESSGIQKVQGVFLRLCADIDDQTQKWHEAGNATEATTLVRLLVDLQEIIQSGRVHNRYSFCVGNVWASRTFWGYVWWGCPWAYWNRCWPTGALFAVLDSMIRFVSARNINCFLFFFYFFSFLTFYIFYNSSFLGIN